MQHTAHPSPTLTEAEAAQYLGISRAYLTASRLSTPRTAGPPYVRIGRAIRYLVPDLDRWLGERRVETREIRTPVETR